MIYSQCCYTIFVVVSDLSFPNVAQLNKNFYFLSSDFFHLIVIKSLCAVDKQNCYTCFFLSKEFNYKMIAALQQQAPTNNQ